MSPTELRSEAAHAYLYDVCTRRRTRCGTIVLQHIAMTLRPIPVVPEEQLQDEFATQEFVLLYKHSPLCGLCDIAIAEVNAFVEANPDVPVWMVDVISQRPLSQRLEAMLGVRHESPQVIMVRRGEPVWNGSHRRVTRTRLEEAIAALP